ncbi:MAG: DegT/DnrJ/EryC1/StrS family aminotransferase [Prevotella sp.]|jgi:dTDP-4-amino-4,6-dideoxygalactose transaminase|nr:DegT/DnrJ/EryC1/StrS family aminotransferase [Prevotella sp.]MDY6240873.1 DegT/DnrJ/EryC1/StrS family aminotransferase [Prevotella sp.]
MNDIPYLSLRKVTAEHLTEIQSAVKTVVDSGWYLKGEATARFEHDYAQYIGTRHCIGCGNGLDALTLIFRAYKEMSFLNDGDEVIVPANAYIASILSITENNLRPILVEPRLEDLEIDPSLLEQCITPNTRAILLVHMYGRCSWTPAIADCCQRHQLIVVEDNAQAAGSIAPDGQSTRRTGSLGDAAAHSFYPGKNLGALGDAGAVTTDNDELADVVRALGNYGSSRKYVFPYKGRNSRMDEIQAAVLDVKLRYLDHDNARRRQIADTYYRQLDNPDIISLPGRDAWSQAQGNDLTTNYHIFPLLCRHRDAMQAWLRSQGVGTMIHYPIPPHRQDCYREWRDLQLPITEAIHAEELSIPCNQTMTDDEVTRVVEAINSFQG